MQLWRLSPTSVVCKQENQESGWCLSIQVWGMKTRKMMVFKSQSEFKDPTMQGGRDSGISVSQSLKAENQTCES